MDGGECVGKRGEGGGDLSVRLAAATYNVDYIRPGTSYPRGVCHPTERSQQRFYLSGPNLSQHTWMATMCVQGALRTSLVVFKPGDDPSWRALEWGQNGERHSRVLPQSCHSSQGSGQNVCAIRGVETEVLEAPSASWETLPVRDPFHLRSRNCFLVV